MGAGQRKLLLVLGMEPIILLQTFGDRLWMAQAIIDIRNSTNDTLDAKFWNRRWIAQAIIGIWNGTNNTFGCKFERWALDSQT